MIDGTNRVLLLLFGLVLAAAGGLGLALNQGLLDDVDQPRSIYADVRDELVADPDLWFAVILGASVVVMVLALVWASRQFTSRPGPPHLSTVVLHADRRGRTTLEPAGLAQAIAGDIGTVDGVRKARVRIVAMGREPSMHVRLDVHRAVDPDALLRRLEPALDRAAESLGVDAVEARVRIDFAGRDTARVV
ncbi:alkaline shock response membrane anchor protein AmaP [Rhabdothermincola salaria]|uniref:alkaline shock response membrane anchor protein AmaP n=1 Tax=Rhabdothermincola salaria TaxID=2903142 RepID=UPI001E5A0F0F|nr:alkaline shock response membrane anchor protein AmaP [Rhabdothermincola salaria]MCD9623957.1 alkaline shock response membrane anchor protein AmaP [Rhabdothermincola salaria]